MAIAKSPFGSARLQRICILNETIIQATNGEPEAVNAVLAHYAGYIRYYSHIYGHYNVDMEDYIKTKLIESLSKFRLDR